MSNSKFCEIKLVEVGTLQKVLAIHPETGFLHLNETYQDFDQAKARKHELEKYQKEIQDAITEGRFKDR